jgi:hypothetical protein
VTGVGSGTSYTVPKAGVITSWSFDDGATTVPGLKLKVGHSAGGVDYKITGEAAAGGQTANAVNTYKTHIPVKAGALIGILQNGGNCGSNTGNGADSFVAALSDVLPGTTKSFNSFAGVKFPVSVRVSEDCVVPNLSGKTLTAAKTALKAASCTLGTVRPPGQTTGTVIQQFPAAGKTLAPQTKVNIRLG